MRNDSRTAAILFATALAMGVPVRQAAGQYLTRPQLAWETIDTPHFSFHFPREMRVWASAVADRMESVAASVNALVGNAPRARVTVVVEDPSNVSNGFAVPLLEGPVIFMWPTPPTPSPSFGAHRGWGEALAVHEYGHIAHLTIPTRNPNERRLWRFLPSRVGPVARKSPAWVIEGYATLIEGRLTGNGRPNSVGRAAVLREWALEGKLPAYGQLDNAGPFLGGSMRYLAGSAFLEWLQSRKGDSSLAYVWRRMSARQQRSFSASVAGVFGAAPEDLYGKFLVDVTARSLEIQRRVDAAGLVEGELVQKLTRGTGEPAVSPDGKLLALALRSADEPSRLVIWKTVEERNDTLIARQRQRLLQRDPLDVPAIDSFPRPKRPLATLKAVAGRSYELPRWLPDGKSLLVSRDELLADGTVRPDLFVWTYASHRVRRLTHGAGIRYADPSPDGASAAAVRCADGLCHLGLVNLANGGWRTLAFGTVDSVWYRPRWSPDGTRIAVSVQAGGRWAVVLVDPRTGARQPLDPGDGAARYAPAWTTSGRSLVVVSERGGIANLERIDVATGAPTTLTRVLGAVLAPDLSRTENSVYFLSLHAKGYDLRRLAVDSTLAASRVVVLDSSETPAAPPRVESPPPVFRAQSAAAAHDYGLGPRHWRVLPGGQVARDGSLATLMVGNIDPIARLGVLAQGGYGSPGAWRGGSLGATLRSLPVDLTAASWYVENRPSRVESPSTASRVRTAEYAGAGLIAQLARFQTRSAVTLRAGASAGRVRVGGLDGVNRSVVFAELRSRLTILSGDPTLVLRIAGHSSSGETGSERWNRYLGTGDVIGILGALGLHGTVSLGSVSAARATQPGRAFEQFQIGGSEVPYFDDAFVSQRRAIPALPAGFLNGSRVGMYRLGVLGFIAEPYVSWLAAGDVLTEWKRVIGVEETFSSPTLGFARLPEVRIRAGAAYSLDDPARRRGNAYFAILYRP
jgi:Tol biopolymer transport system component